VRYVVLCVRSSIAGLGTETPRFCIDPAPTPWTARLFNCRDVCLTDLRHSILTASFKI
jgi:hypothetical protein